MEQFEQQLQNLWQEGGRDLAVSFLKRAVSPEMPLAKLVAALNFRDVQNHLGSITLRDILGAVGRPEATATAEAAQERPKAKKATRRKRRSAAELDDIRSLVVGMLVDEPGSLNTTQIVAGLAQEGQDFDSMRVNALMRTLQQEELVSDLGGKPKAWRATAKLRQQKKS